MNAGVVLCPGRTGDLQGLTWLTTALGAAGAVVEPVRYDPEARYLEGDVPLALAARDRLRDVLGPDAPLFACGHSRGGTVALLAAAEDDGWDGVIALSATTDQQRLVAGLRDFAPSRYAAMVAARGGASPEQDPGHYRRTSPLLRAGQITCPVLLVHGTLDLVVPHDHALWLGDVLGDVELVLLDGLGHFFERTYSGHDFIAVTQPIADWMRRHTTRSLTWRT
jgi:pimeloyl-ACP methyl ester carboxylesterase